MLSTASAAAVNQVPVRAFNVFFGLGIPAPLQKEGFDGVLEPLKPLGKKLLIMRNVDQVRCDESGINAHFDGRFIPIHIQILDEDSNDLDIDQGGLKWVSSPS